MKMIAEYTDYIGWFKHCTQWKRMTILEEKRPF